MSKVNRRRFLKLMGGAAGALALSVPAGKVVDQYISEPLRDIAGPIERLETTLDALATDFGSSSSISDLKSVVDKLNEESDSAEANRIKNVYSKIIEAYDGHQSSLTFYDKVLATLRAAQTHIGEVGEAGDKLKRNMSVLRELDERIIGLFKPLLPDVSGEEGVSDYEKYQKLHEKIRAYERVMQELKKYGSDFERSILVLNNEYIMNPKRNLSERSGALDEMERVAQSYIGTLKMLKQLEKGGHKELPNVQEALYGLRDFRSRMKADAAKYGFLDKKSALESVADDITRAGQVSGGIVGAICGYFAAGLASKFI